MHKVLITTVPFCERDYSPIQMLQAAGVDYLINPIGRKLEEDELADMANGFDALIAGTEPITARVMARAGSLKFISRVGVGLDSVDLPEAARRGIKVSYTPEAPAPAVADLTIGLMFSLLRSIHLANQQMHRSEWQRYFGRRMSRVTVGLIGAGRIGGHVLRSLVALGASRIIVNDTNLSACKSLGLNFERVEKETIYRKADVISLHVPLTPQTKNLIRREQLLAMKKDALLINTARGGIVNEKDLATVMLEGHLSGVAIDVFEKEPYCGELAQIERCLLTSHMGSMSIDCRTQMEIEATEEVVRFILGQPLRSLVPPAEYELQRQGFKA